MSALPQFRSTTDLQKNYVGVLADLTNGPVFLLQRQAVAAVIVSPVEWERLQKELADAKRSHLAMLKQRADSPDSEFISLEDALAGMPQ